MQMNITTKIILDTRREKDNGKYPVKLRVTYNRNQRYYPYQSRYDLSQLEFAEVFNPNPKGRFKKLQDTLVAERMKADAIIESIAERFSFVLFEKMFKQVDGQNKDVFALLKDRTDKLRGEGQISTAVITSCALESLKKFHPKTKLDIADVDVNFLEQYEKSMLTDGRSNTTIGMYLRVVRTIYNDLIADQSIPKELYPFGHRKGQYQIPTGRNVKRALRHAEVGLIYNYQPKSEAEAKARDMWLLTYLANGINMKDIALLKFKNWDRQNNMIRFERAKTRRSNKGKAPVIISFVVTPDIRRIISRWGNKSIYDGNHIFPILNNNSTPDDVYKSVYNAVKFTNKYMKAITKDLGITGKVRTYEARHSFGSILRNSGKSVEFIGESFGHSSIKTTQNYLASFEDSAKQEAAELLTNFPETGTY